MSTTTRPQNRYAARHRSFNGARILRRAFAVLAAVLAVLALCTAYLVLSAASYRAGAATLPVQRPATMHESYADTACQGIAFKASTACVVGAYLHSSHRFPTTFQARYDYGHASIRVSRSRPVPMCLQEDGPAPGAECLWLGGRSGQGPAFYISRSGKSTLLP